MKKSKKLIAVLLLFAACMMAFSACGSPKTLEEYLEKNKDEKTQIEDYAKKNNMEITVKENTVTFVYKLSSDVSDEYLKIYQNSFKNSFDNYKSQFVTQVKDLEEETKITGIKFVINVVDKSGKDIYSVTYTSEG